MGALGPHGMLRELTRRMAMQAPTDGVNRLLTLSNVIHGVLGLKPP